MHYAELQNLESAFSERFDDLPKCILQVMQGLKTRNWNWAMLKQSVYMPGQVLIVAGV
jgi:hypothetical protein